MSKKKLVKCEACEKELSIEADKCPHCGQPNNSSERIIRKMKEGLAGLVVVVVIVFAAYLYFKDSPEEKAQKEARREEASKEYEFQQSLTNQCEAMVKPSITHPSTYSRNFGTESIKKDGGYIVHLYFSAKNAYNLELSYHAVCKYSEERNRLDLIKVNERQR